MKTTINVTQEDIDAGHPCNAGSCPIARAVNRILSGYRVGVPGRSISIYRLDARGDIDAIHSFLPLPTVCFNFINRFDNDLSVEPFTFELDIPGELLRQTESARAT